MFTKDTKGLKEEAQTDVWLEGIWNLLHQCFVSDYKITKD